MKHYTTLIFLLFSLSLSAQFRMVSNGLPSWTVLTDSTYSATINLFSDLTGGSFNGTQVDNTMRMFTDRATIYTVDSVLSVALSQVVIRVKEYGSTNGTPAGQLMIYDPNGQTAVPQVPFGNTGATAKLQAAVDSYNSSVIGSGGGGDVSSVNGQTGVVVLDPDDLDDSATTNKFTTASDISKLAGIESGAQVNRKEVPVILFIGESNSGGQALNSALSVYELSESKKVQILYDTAFQNLDIGVNNQYLHYNATLTTQLDPATQHGWENGLRKAIDKHNLSNIYLVKAGQGGSTISMWEPTDTFTRIFETKIANAEAAFAVMNLKPVYYIWMSFGINDEIANTDTATWKTDTQDWIDRIRTTIGQNASICLTELPPTYTLFDTPLQEIADEDDRIFFIPAAELPLDNSAHWSNVGMDSIAQRMFRVFRDSVWNNGVIRPTELSAGTVVSGNYLERDSIYAFVDESTPGAGTDATYTSLTNATDSGGGIITFGTPANARGKTVQKISRDSFIVQWQIGTLAEGKSVVVYIDSVSGVNTTYARSLVSIGGAYTFDTGVLVRLISASEATVYSGVSANAYMRMRSSGSDMILSHSPDGITFTDYYTYTNALLTAPDSLYIKCYQVIAGDGSRFADITLNPEVGVTIPPTETLSYEGFVFLRSSGSPEGFQEGGFGDQYTDTETGDLYIKKTVSGNTGWEKQEAGTVTSVGLSMPSIFSVSGSPVTGSGTLTATFSTQPANRFLAGPATGADAALAVRSLVVADIPTTITDTLPAHNTRLQDLEAYAVQSYAVIYKGVVDTYATTTTPDTIDGTWVADVSDDFSHSNGVITYNGTLAKRFLVTVTASVESNTVTSEYYLRITEDGSVKAESSQYFLTADAPETMSCQGVVVLTTGKTFFLTGAALAGTPDIKFNTITFSLSRL